MKKEAQPKVTLVYHPNKALGQKYEVSKIVGTVVVKYAYHDTAKRTMFQQEVRVHDFIDEDHALALADAAEVTTIQEK